MVKGYKVFNPDWTCRGKQYSCPGKFEEDVPLCMCEAGMHFCKKAVNCFNYYSFDPSNHVAEVIAYGDVLEKDDKCCTDKLEIVREIPWAELLEMVNTGGGNTGKKNSGDRNSGDGNSGDGNSGDGNSGHQNSGDGNSGDQNSGHQNSGDWNKCNHSTGCFNTKEQKMYFFNQPSDWTYRDWYYSKAREILCEMSEALKYIQLNDMTDEERKKHPEAETTGGYLRKMDNTEAVNEWWKKLKIEDKDEIKALPNFDSKIFKEITGIDVDDIS